MFNHGLVKGIASLSQVYGHIYKRGACLVVLVYAFFYGINWPFIYRRRKNQNTGSTIGYG